MDVDVPILTDEDIDSIVQNINDIEPTSQLISSVNDNSVNEMEKQVQEINKPSLDPSSADNKEIDVIQKHVEDSLLFLDNNKTVNVSEKVEQTTNLEPIKEVVWETAESLEKCDKKTGDSEDKVEDISLEPSLTPASQNAIETAMLVDEVSNVIDTEYMNKDIENTVESGISIEQVKTPVETHQQMDVDVDDVNPISSVQEGLDGALSVEHIQKEIEHPCNTERENIVNSEQSQATTLPLELTQICTENTDNMEGKNSEELTQKGTENTDNMEGKNSEDLEQPIDNHTESVDTGNMKDTHNTVNSEVKEEILLLQNSQIGTENTDNMENNDKSENSEQPKENQTEPIGIVVNSEQSGKEILPVEYSQNEIEITANVEKNQDTVNFEQSESVLIHTPNVSDSLKETDKTLNLETNIEDMSINNNKDAIAEDIHNSLDTGHSNENVLESSVPEQQESTETQIETDESLPDNAQNKTNEIAENIDENDSNVQNEPQNTISQLNTPLNNEQKELNEVSEKIEGTVHKMDEVLKNEQESEVVLKLEKQSDDSKHTGVSNDVTDSPHLDKPVETVNESVSEELLQIRETSVQGMDTLPTPSKQIETISEVEQNETDNIENQILTESNDKPSDTNDKEINVEPHTQENIPKCSNIKLESNIEMEVDESSVTKTSAVEVTIKQEILDITPTTLEKSNKETELNTESLGNNDNMKQVEIKQENSNSTSTHKVNKPKSNETTENIQTKSNIIEKPQDAKAISKPFKKPAKNLVFENFVLNKSIANRVALKIMAQHNVPNQSGPFMAPVAPIVPSYPPADDGNIWSKATGKSMLSNDAVCPPAKRTRYEPTWSTAAVTSPWALNESTDTQSPEPTATPVWETTGSSTSEAANRPQSSCSSVPDETPMDLDNVDLQAGSSVADESSFSMAELEEFYQWCSTQNAIKEFNSLSCSPHVPLKESVYKLANKCTEKLRIKYIPKSFSQADVHLILKKYTIDAGQDITKKISRIIMDKVSSPIYATAYLKWKYVDRLLAAKTFLLMRRADLCLDGKNLAISFDFKDIIYWNKDGRPIFLRSKKRGLDPNASPFFTGEINCKDTELYGLSKDFLFNLKIKLPLTNVVRVKNADVTIGETQLRVIFSRAGFIRTLIINEDSSLTIEYDHDLEAVQAISMFNNQQLNSRPLSVTLDRKAVTTLKDYPLPEGLTEIGPGLGVRGKPIQSVRTIMEIGRLRTWFNRMLITSKTMLQTSNNKYKEAAAKLNALEQKVKHQNKIIQNFKAAPNEPAVVTPSPQQAVADLSTAIVSSIQTNLMSLIGAQNLTQNVPQPVAPSTAAPTWATSTETPNWAQATALPEFTPNVPIQPLAYSQPQPSFVGLQPGPPGPSALQPNLQTGPQTSHVHLNMQTGSIQPAPVYLQPEYITQYPVPVPSTVSSVQSGFPVTPAPVAMPSVPVTHHVVYPPVSATNQTPTVQPKFSSRFDIPPPVIRPQNRGQIQLAPVTVQPALPQKPTEPALEIPLPKTKPQNRGPVKPIATLRTVPLIKPPKPAGIKINIASFQIPGTSKLDLDAIPPPPKPKKNPETSTNAASKALKRKSAMRRDSKSPESSRTHSPRYERSKDDSRRERYHSRERNHSKDRETDFYRSPPYTAVLFKYLPPSVKSEDLREKMWEIGKVLSAEVNRRGQAIVKFRSKRDADTCIEMYNLAKVDGKTIEAKLTKHTYLL